MKLILNLILSVFFLSSAALAEECTSNCEMYPTTTPSYNEEDSSSSSSSTTSEYDALIKTPSLPTKKQKKLKAYYFCDVYNINDCIIVYK